MIQTAPLAVFLAVFMAFYGVEPAFAHKLKLFAAAEGAEISGYAYFSGGNRAQGVQIHGECDGKTVFSGVTDAQGGFRFTATKRADYLLNADSGDGHAARFTVAAAELPENLAASSGPVPQPDAPPLNEGPLNKEPSGAGTAPPESMALTILVERAVARQIRPLREQLDAYEQTVRLRDALGGVGFIIGLAGFAYGLSTRGLIARRKKGAP